MKVDGGGTGVVANVGRLRNKHGVGDVSAAGAPLLDGANLRSLIVGGPWGFEFFWQRLELAFGLFDEVINLVGPGLRVVEGVDHPLEREREL